MNLLSRDAQSYISRHIYDSDIPINLNSFEFVEDFEKLLLKEFESFKFAFEKLDLPDKNDVIKFWVSKRENEFDAYLEFSPRNLKSFDLAQHYNIGANDIVARDAIAMIDIPPPKIFYIEHYLSKFTNLIIYFLLFEEEYMKEVLVNPIANKGNYNPLEWLNLESEISYNQFNLSESPFNTCSKKNMGRLYWLLSRSTRPIGDKIVRDFCMELCDEYGIIYSDTIRQNFKKIHKNELGHFKSQIFPLLSPDILNAINPALEYYF